MAPFRGSSLTDTTLPVFRLVPLVAGPVVAAVGAGALIGWATGIEALRSMLPGRIAMIPNTAVGFLVAGAALLLLSVPSRPRGAATLGRVLGVLVTALGFATLLERVFLVDFGIDLLLFEDAVRRYPWTPPGRMAINSTVGFTFAGLALVFLDLETRFGRRPSELLALLVMLIAFLALVGYAYGVQPLYRVGQYTDGMALLTALAFAILGTGILFARPDRGFAALMTGRDASGVLSRQLLPPVILVPVLLGGFWRMAVQADTLDAETGVTIFAITIVAWFVTLIARAMRAVHAMDLQREHLLQRAEEARAEAEEANRAKMDFLTTMSHELRTPLNAIAGYVDILDLGLHGPLGSEQRKDLQRIKRSQHHLLSLINDVLNFARMEAGRVEFVLEPIALSEVVREVEALVLPQLQAKELAYQDAGCDPSLVAVADSEKVRQILLNLLSNAVKFTEAGGAVRVECAPAGPEVVVRVTDTGVGIPEEKLGTIFEPFVQLDRGLTSSHQGTGLGLAISRDLARAMGGDLSVDSTVGAGSTFTLRLPRGEGVEVAAGALPEREPLAPTADM